MKRWLPRTLWLLAWSFWVWCGFGLARELPRDLGPVVCRLPIGEQEVFLGWIADEPTAVTIESQENLEPSVVRVYDGVAGGLRAKFAGPVKRNGGFSNEYLLRHAAILCEKRPPLPGKPPTQGASVLELRTGAWIDLLCSRRDFAAFAPTAPLALFSRDQDSDGPRKIGGVVVGPTKEERWCVYVLDVRDGHIVTKLTGNTGGEPVRDLGGCLFLSDDELAVETWLVRGDDEEASPDDRRVEIWRLDARRAPARVFKGVHIGQDPTFSRNGRVAWHALGVTPPPVDVFDFNVGKFVLSPPPHPARKTLGGVSGYWPGPIIAADGRSVYVPMASTLWDVDRGTVIWKGGDMNGLSVLDFGQRVLQSESWSLPLLSQIPKLDLFALRDMSTLRLVHRTWKSIAPRGEDSSGSREWHLSENNEVFRLPPRINYALLALCHTILALPLILLWTILRWRRNRRLRLASATL